MLKLVLFDLDGTLLDTAPDLGHALNMQRELHGLAPLSAETIRPYASHGSMGLLSIGFGLTPDHAEFSAMRTEYLSLYDQVVTRSPIVFDGIAELLAGIENKGLRWGIVTNKPRRFTEPILKAIHLYDRAACVVCSDDAARAKPFPDTLLLACKLTQTQPSECLYVGDAERDIQAGDAAGMRTIVCLYGYIDDNDAPHEWGAHHTVQQPAELLAFIE
ncbi:MAG TPA: HAD-IA family hydrolase [Methylophilaceae bacterium]|nr:HAD-IA family hydrolase [Methylophilaceae bacterium]